jgi:hypothetical protein
VGLAAIAVLGLAVTMFVRPFTRGAEAPSEATVLRISMSGWSQKVVEAPADGAIRITMVNLDNRFHTDGGGWHNFVLPSLDFEARVAPKGTETFTVELNELPPGEYEFYCDICCGGKDNPFMQGTLRVS